MNPRAERPSLATPFKGGVRISISRFRLRWDKPGRISKWDRGRGLYFEVKTVLIKRGEIGGRARGNSAMRTLWRNVRFPGKTISTEWEIRLETLGGITIGRTAQPIAVNADYFINPISCKRNRQPTTTNNYNRQPCNTSEKSATFLTKVLQVIIDTLTRTLAY